MTLALAGVRIVDLTQVMAGPFCTMLLADLGADIIKVEPPSGDLSRSMGGRRLQMKGDDRAPFLALNRNKRSVVLDLKQSTGRDHLLSLLRDADVMVESFRPGVAERLGVAYPDVNNLNPRLVYASISGFGPSGPWADRPGFDLIAQGMAGVMSVTGSATGERVKCGIPVSDLAAGLYAANGIQAALLARARTGRGQRVDTSLFESALGLSVWEATEFWATGEAPLPLGSAHRLSAPYQAFHASDGALTIAALTAPHWERLCAVLGRPELVNDERYASNGDRLQHRESLTAAIERALANGTVDEWVTRLLAAGIPCGPILDYDQVEHLVQHRLPARRFAVAWSSEAVPRPSDQRLGEAEDPVGQLSQALRRPPRRRRRHGR
jgi:formyl-CoA transferase